MRFRPALGLAAIGLFATLACASGPEAATGGHPVFDRDLLHEIEIRVEERYLEQLDRSVDSRVPCEFVFDGQTFLMAGIRRKGGINSVSPLSEKPAFSVKLNAFYGRQRLAGLDKLILNNAVQDAGFLNEHLGYELYRRAGLIAPRTAHAVVSLNGRPLGIYIVREPIDRQFIEGRFGTGSFRGDLFEGSCPYDDPCTDFMRFPERMELKREHRENRNRKQLMALIRTIRDTPDSEWREQVAKRLDLDAFITGFAIDALVSHWDGYAFNMNNYYLFQRPADGRFVFIPHGMDSIFGVDGLWPRFGAQDVYKKPSGYLAKRVLALPELRAQWEREIQRILREVWIVPELRQDIERVRRTLRSTSHRDKRTRSDLERFRRSSRRVLWFLEQRKEKFLATQPAVDAKVAGE